MTDENMELLRDFRSEVPQPDEETIRRAYAQATRPPRKNWLWIRPLRPSTKRVRAYVAAAAAIALAGTAAMILIFNVTERGAPANKTGQSANDFLGIGSAPTVTHPLGPTAKQVSLADASSALGGSLTLPNSALASPSDLGAVWMNSLHGSQTGESSVAIAVTFPADSLVVKYSRPAYQDPIANYEDYISNAPAPEARVIYLNGVPALTNATTRPDGSSWAFVEFVDQGTIISVMGNTNQSTLQGVAQSILNEASSN